MLLIVYYNGVQTLCSKADLDTIDIDDVAFIINLEHLNLPK